MWQVDADQPGNGATIQDIFEPKSDQDEIVRRNRYGIMLTGWTEDGKLYL